MFRLPKIPLIETLKTYSFEKARADLPAAFNVALLDFPQGMAYAMIAGLPYYVGIFASIIAATIAPVFASSRFIMLGPTNAIAVMCLATFLGLGLSQDEVMVAMPLFLLMVSVFMLIGAGFKLANLVNYVSRTVITGYISAAAFLIIVKQLKYVLGITVPDTSTFASSFYYTLLNLSDVNGSELEIAVLTIALYAIFRRISKKLPAVALSLFLVYFVGVGFSTFWGIELASLSNGTMVTPKLGITLPTFSFELISTLAPGALAISFLSLLESSSIAKTLAAQAGDTVDPNQQMVSLGMANIGCSFFGGMPISGSLTRSMLNFKSGAKSPISSIFSGSILALLFFVLGPYVGHIPKASLAALVIVVGVSLFNRKNIRYAMGTTHEDRIVFVITLLSGLFFTLNTAIFLGVITSMLLFIKKASNPSLVEYSLSNDGLSNGSSCSEGQAVALLHVEGDLFFASSDMFLSQARNLANNPQLKAIIVRMRNAHNIDATCAMALEQFATYAREKMRFVIVAGANEELMDILHKSKLIDILGKENVIPEDSDNPTLSTSLALKRAVSLVGDQIDLKLFVSEKQGE